MPEIEPEFAALKEAMRNAALKKAEAVVAARETLLPAWAERLKQDMREPGASANPNPEPESSVPPSRDPQDNPPAILASEREEEENSQSSSPLVTADEASIDSQVALNPYGFRRRGKHRIPRAAQGASLSPEPRIEERETESEANEAALENLESLTPAVTALPSLEAVESAPVDGETLYQKINRLNEEVTDLRRRYVQEDGDQTSLRKKLASFLRVRTDFSQGEWRKLYEEKIIELQQAEVAMMQGEMDETGKRLSRVQTKEGMERLLRYYKLDEHLNLIEERTRYQAEHKDFPVMILDSLGALGRRYNALSFKQKMMLTAALAGVAGGAALAGGAVTGAATALMWLKRGAAGAGVAVGMEAIWEKKAKDKRGAQAGEEVDRQLAGLSGSMSEPDFSGLSALLEADARAGDAALQQEKRASTLRKAGAITVGGLVGGSTLLSGFDETSVVQESADGREAVMTPAEEGSGGARENLTTSSAAVQTPPSLDITHGLPFGLTTDLSESPGEGMVYDPGSGGTLSESAKFPEGLNGLREAHTVQPGESVWRILEARAAGLEGAQKTYFIDALKDRLGELSPQEVREMGITTGSLDKLIPGETIDFSKHLTPDVVQTAWEEAHAVAQEPSASSLASSESASLMPSPGVPERLSDSAVAPATPDSIAESAGSASPDAPSPEAEVEAMDGLQGTDIQYDRAIILGNEYDLKQYKSYFIQHPDAFDAFRKTGETYLNFIFENDQGAIRDTGEKTFADLARVPEEETERLEQFVRQARDAYGVRLGTPAPQEKVYEYVARMSMIGIEHPTGKPIFLPRAL